MNRLWSGLILTASALAWVPSQVGCYECGNELEERFVCACCHGPGCFGLPGKHVDKKVTVCAPDAEVARGYAEEQLGSSDSTCGACRPKGQGEGTGEDAATERGTGPS